MNIRENGFIVTGLPVAESIHVEPDGDSFRIIVRGTAYTPEEWRVFTDACVYVRDRLAGMVPQTVPESADGPWDRIEDVPAHISRVLDRDGDQWGRVSDGDWPEPSDYLNRYAPFSLRLPR